MVRSWKPIWVELWFRGQRLLVELEDHGRPLGVGSGFCSDLRIDDARVALVHCELIRVGDSIWLVPSGSADVRLNAAHVGKGRVLPERGVIEFLEYEILVVLHVGAARRSARPESDSALQDTPPVTLRSSLS
jgi:hypothetical protein